MALKYFERWCGLYASERSVILARRAFSLVELVIVLVIIGIIASIAVPRFTRTMTKPRPTEMTR